METFISHQKIGNLTIIYVFSALINDDKLCILVIPSKKTCFSILPTGFGALRVNSVPGQTE